MNSAPQKPPANKPPKKSALRRVVKIIISLACLAIVYRSVNLRNLWQSLSSVSPLNFAFLCFVYTLGQIISASKWRVFLKEAGVVRTFGQATQAYFSGMFVNAFGFGTVGGDLTRALAVRPEKGKRSGALGSVLADRVHGLGVLFAIGAISVIIIRPPVLEPYGVLASLTGTLFLGSCFWFGPRILKKLFPRDHKLGVAAVSIASAFPHSARPFWFVTVFSAVFHLSQVALVFFISQAIGVNQLSLPYLLATVPFVNIAAALPISMNGIGVREAMFLFLFTPVGVSSESTAALGALWLLMVAAVSALGGFAISQVVEPVETSGNELATTPIESESTNERIRSVG